MSQAPQQCHDLQRVIWDQIVKAHGYPPLYPEGVDTDATFNQPFHHSIPLSHALNELVKADVEAKGMEILTEQDPAYDRTKYTLINTAYLNVDDGTKKVNRAVEISNLVYSADTTFVSNPKKGDAEDEKSGKMPIKTEANIPVVFMSAGKSVTRHFQENMPSHVYDGMTNRLLETLPAAIYTFLKTGIIV